MSMNNVHYNLYMEVSVMPNWCRNELTIYGNSESIKKFKSAVFGYKMPSDDCVEIILSQLHQHVSSEAMKQIRDVIQNDGLTLYNLDVLFEKLYPIPQEMVDSDDYDEINKWCIKHWGTKADAWDIKVHIIDECSISFTFYTAWSPPIEWVDHVASLFPDVNFDLEYSEPGMGFSGQHIVDATIRQTAE